MIKVIVGNPFNIRNCAGWYNPACLQPMIGLCDGNDDIDTIWRAIDIINHEFTHMVLFNEISIAACNGLDNIQDIEYAALIGV